MNRGVKMLLVFSILGCNGLLMADYATHSDTHRPYPSFDDMSDDPENHLYEYGYSWMRVRDVTAEGFTVGDADRRLTVVYQAKDVKPGDSVQVFGVLRPNRRIDAERVIVSPRANRLYMYAVSLGAVFLTVVTFLGRWTFDRRRLVFRSRNSGRRDG